MKIYYKKYKKTRMGQSLIIPGAGLFAEEDIKSNELITEIYARENYVIGNAVNYAYILDKEGYIHILNIKGPNDKADEIAKIVYDVFYSLKF